MAIINAFSIIADVANDAVMSGDLIQLGSSWSWLSDVFRSLFMFLDSVIYYIIPELYELALELGKLNDIFNEQEILKSLSNSLYTFFSLVMFFRYAFSILTMIADPDKIEDKQKGLSKIVMNSIIALVLIVATPTIFNIGYEIQGIMIGTPGKQDGLLYKAFVKLSDSDELNIVGENEGVRFSKLVFNMFINTSNLYEGTKKDEIELVFAAYKNNPKFDASVFNKHITEDFENVYAIAYLGPISTIIGVYIAFTLLFTTTEIALRSVKLFVLQLISPIAIITYVDPDSATKGIFKRWVSESLKTYLSLFFRLAVMYLFVTIIGNIDYSKLLNLNFWALIFFILGAISFIKIAPKMFEEVFGYKAGDKVWGNEIIKKGLAFGGRLTTAAVGAGLGAVGGAISGGLSSKAHKLGFGAGAKVGLGAGLKAGAKAGFNAKNLGGYLKVPFAGLAGRKASQKEYGYKSLLPFTEGAGEKTRYNTEIALAAREFESYKEAFEESANTIIKDKDGKVVTAKNSKGENVPLDAARNYAREKMKEMNANWKLEDFKREDVSALRKSYAKGEAYKKMFSKENGYSEEYGKALDKYVKAKAEQQVFERGFMRAQTYFNSAYSLASPEEKKNLKAQFDALISARGAVEKNVNSAKERLEEYDKNPAYSKETALFKRLERADKLPKDEESLIKADVSIKDSEDWEIDVEEFVSKTLSSSLTSTDTEDGSGKHKNEPRETEKLENEDSKDSDEKSSSSSSKEIIDDLEDMEIPDFDDKTESDTRVPVEDIFSYFDDSDNPYDSSKDGSTKESDGKSEENDTNSNQGIEESGNEQEGNNAKPDEGAEEQGYKPESNDMSPEEGNDDELFIDPNGM